MAVATILSPGVSVGGKYEVVEVIGFGGMGVVYKVREQVGAVSRIRALKTVLPQFASDPTVARRFRQEAEKMCMLEHENIVPVLSYSEEGQFPYLVMPFIEGQTLKEYLTAYTAEHACGLPLSEVMEIGLELVRGLEIAHRFVNPETRRPQPMVHRDIKPGNIMVRVDDESGERRLKVLIMDFGIAKVLSDQDSGHSLTEVIGTVKYASPEQIRRGKDIDPRADIYSLGMVLFELYAGRHMFTGLSEHSVLMRMVQRDLKDFEIPFPEGTPERFRQLINRCVAVDRDHRFPNVGEMRALMRRILEEDSERIETEAAHAREVAQSERARAVERGAEQFATRLLADGDEMLAKGDAAIADRRQGEALSPLRSAAEAFARAAEESTASRERDRLERGLSALAELRALALAADAERLAPGSVVAAAEATRVLERALEVGDLTGGGHALAQAELAWRQAHDAARAEQLRLDALAGCDRLEAAIAATRAELAHLPEELREAGVLADVELAETRARAARTSTSAGDFEGASQAAAAAMALLAEVDRRRVRLLSQQVDDLSERLRSRLASIDASPDVDRSDPAHAETHAAADAAQRLAAEGRHLDALAAFEGTLKAVEELERQIAGRAAEREQRLRAAERNRNAEPAAQAALESLRSARAAVATAGTPAGVEVSELAAAVDEADHAESEFGRGEYAAALATLRSAGKRLSDLAEAISRRIERERVLARLTSLRADATQKTKALGALGAWALDALQSRPLLDALASAEQHAGQGDLSEAIRILEESLPKLDRRAAEARIELELRRARDEAAAARERARAALAAAERLGERATLDRRFALGRDDVDRGLDLYEAERFAEASSRFAAGQHALAELRAEIEEGERVERLAALGRRRAVVVEGLGHLPTTRRMRRRLKAIRKALGAADDALAVADESEAARRLDEIESSLHALVEQAATQKAAEPLSGFAWRAVAIGGGAAAASLVATLVWIGRPKTPPGPLAEAIRVPPISEPTMPREREPTAAVEARATVAPPLEPTLAPISAPPSNAPVVQATMPPVVEATIPPVVEATRPPVVVEATHAPVVEPTVPERPPPLVLASARPTTRTVKVRTGSEPRFDASLKNGDDRSLQWQLGGETVGRGRSIVLGKELTGTPGRKRLDVVAMREGLPTPLRSWDLEIEAPPLGFASLEPANRSLERPPGVPVSFRAPVNLSQSEKLAFLWKVNGEPAHGADGPTYDFQPQSPGNYEIQVRATAPWGATIANTWKLSVRPPVVPTPDLRSAVVEKPDPSAGAQAWIQAYCTAFEKKDVEALVTLGHLSSQTEAARLRDALASMNDLKVSCTNPTVRATGDDAVVSFDRTDRWTDPRGTAMERALPRITKRLHLANGRWVATP